ncbi:hypothetical protein [endosymbiont GvMRE of Glomus versiforme]|uniref:hypothetical protein n=1 Tax=endosymbiont GvMRE of Glomus versiforme TaxID=2039283 RepID=UPI000EC49670|nr:hypothetical protein [endosymbiont GvMRE of Glomus versiforme]RHZ36502.1 hypothetical protein GvMRE_I2g211 [endosymbiont GvMRE of Glomus versiforme]
MDKDNFITKQRKEELEKILVAKSRFLKHLPRFFIDERRGSKTALFVFPSFLVKQSATAKKPTSKFVWLGEKREWFLIDPDSSVYSHYEATDFREITKKSEEIRKTIENILVEQFARNLDNYHIIEEICNEENYNPNCIKSFSELKKDNLDVFFNNLYKYIDFLVYGRNKDLTENITNNKFKESIFCGSEKDVLIIAEPETYKFIKQNDTNNFLQNLVGDIICANLKNGIKLIMIAKWGILAPYFIKPYSLNDFHYINIYYEISLANITPAVAFKE